MDEKTSEKIIKYIESKGQASGHELADYLNITTRAVRKQLANLLETGILDKVGRSPKVFYILAGLKVSNKTVDISNSLKKLIDDNFLIITPSGEQKDGFDGFIYWCTKQNIPVEKTAAEYEQTIKKYAQYKKNGLIDGMQKIKDTFNDVFIDKIFYLDFYAIERFGKTKLGQLLLYAKQSQNRVMIRNLVEQIKPRITAVISDLHIDAIGYIPPTVKREVQLMREIEKQLNIALPILKLVKVKTPIAVPQKTLNKLDDRIENAKSTIVVDESKKYKTILLIDDALGSGATINETARKIKNQGVAEKVIGLAITGSFSGFEIISEV